MGDKRKGVDEMGIPLGEGEHYAGTLTRLARSWECMAPGDASTRAPPYPVEQGVFLQRGISSCLHGNGTGC